MSKPGNVAFPPEPAARTRAKVAIPDDVSLPPTRKALKQAKHTKLTSTTVSDKQLTSLEEVASAESNGDGSTEFVPRDADARDNTDTAIANTVPGESGL